MNAAEKEVLQVGIDFLGNDCNQGWFSYSTKKPERYTIRDHKQIGFNNACIRIARCGILETKEGAGDAYPDIRLARLSTIGIAKILMGDPDLLPEGDKVRVKSNGKYGVVVGYETPSDGSYFIVIIDGERDKKYYRFGEIEYVPDL